MRSSRRKTSLSSSAICLVTAASRRARPAPPLPRTAASAAASARSPRSSRSAMPGQRRAHRLAEPPFAPVLVQQSPQQRQVRLLGGVHRGDRRHPASSAAAALPVFDSAFGLRVRLEPLGQIRHQPLEQVALSLDPIVDPVVRVLNDHVQRPGRTDLRARRWRPGRAPRRGRRRARRRRRPGPARDPTACAPARPSRPPPRAGSGVARAGRRRGRPGRRLPARSRRWPKTRSRWGGGSPARGDRRGPGCRPAGARRSRRSGGAAALRGWRGRTRAPARTGRSRPRSA